MSYKKISAVTLFFRFFILFLVVFTTFSLGVEIFRQKGISNVIDKYLSADTWQTFAKKQLIISIFYALFMTIYQKFIKGGKVSL